MPKPPAWNWNIVIWNGWATKPKARATPWTRPAAGRRFSNLSKIAPKPTEGSMMIAGRFVIGAAVAALAGAAAGRAAADVVNVAANGFEVRETVHVAASTD